MSPLESHSLSCPRLYGTTLPSTCAGAVEAQRSGSLLKTTATLS